ncbi:hypothetical protein F4802DRAFT_595359 [Xylaria palmicola]|nr:hypothetical protein F4802DRAFT_595359 [Xylaria palmicola]
MASMVRVFITRHRISINEPCERPCRSFGARENRLIFGTVALNTSLPSTLQWNIDRSLENFLQAVDSNMDYGPYKPELVQVQDGLQVPQAYECDEVNQDIFDFGLNEIDKQQRFGETTSS